MTSPDYWPLEEGETTPVVKSTNNAFNWRRPGEPIEPLTARRPPAPYPAKRGPKKAGGFAKNGGTMASLTRKREGMLAPRGYGHNEVVEPTISPRRK